METAILAQLNDHQALACLLGAFFAGTGLVTFLASLSGQGVLSPLTVLLFCFLGNTLSDICWFALGRTNHPSLLTANKRFTEAQEKLAQHLARYQGRDYLLFILVKFIYGLRIAAILSLGTIRYSWRRFLQCNIPAVLLINVLAVVVGWAAGRGVGFFVNVFENFQLSLALLVVVILVPLLLTKAVINRLLRRKKYNRNAQYPPHRNDGQSPLF